MKKSATGGPGKPVKLSRAKIRQRAADAVATPLRAARLERARSMLTMSPQNFYTLPTEFDLENQLQSATYEDTKALEGQIDDYFQFKIDYYPHFEGAQSWRKGPRTYFVDINDEVIEAKFPLDRDIRALISGFRIAFRRNRVAIITIKRWIQAVLVALLLAPPSLAALASKWGLTIAPAYWLGWVALVVFGAAAAIWYQRQKEDQLRVVVNSTGRVLANEIQSRVNSLIKNFTDFLANIDREEAHEDMTNVEWTRRSAWWATMTMWNPKRIEYIEKFLQSEMQRLRIDYLNTGFVGSAIARGVLIAGVSSSAVPFYLSYKMDTPIEAMGLPLIVWGFGVAGSLLVTTLSMKTSLALADVQESLGREPMGRSSRFADVELHKKISEQIRRDKEKLRQAKLSGGYGYGAGDQRRA